MKILISAFALSALALSIAVANAAAPGGAAPARGPAPGAGPASAPASGPATTRAGRGGGRGFGGGAPLPAMEPGKSPVADGATPVKLGDGFKFTEGATSNKEGDIFFVDQDSNRIHKWTFDKTPGNTDPLKGTMSTWMDPSGRANGMCFDLDGNLIACADEKNELWSITPDKKVTVLIKELDGKPLNGPNDVWIIPTGPNKGGMYLSDPLFSRSWWTDRPGGRGQQQPGRYVYFLKPERETLVPVVTDLMQPNGVIGTPDGKMLYVSDMNGGKTFSYTIKDDGTLADKKDFCPMGSDGMTIDSDGNVYTTSNGGQGVCIWSKEGKLIGQIPIGSANICFGGKDRNILFINSRAEVWGVKMKTHGVGPQ